jgi:hypothetical protein
MFTKENRWLRGKKWSRKIIKRLEKAKVEPYKINIIKNFYKEN